MKGNVTFFEDSCNTNQEQLLSLIYVSMKVYNNRLFLIRAVLCVCFQMMQVVKMYAGRFLFKFRSLNGAVFIIMAFCEPSNPLRIWERTKNLMIQDFRRRHTGMVLNDGLSEDNVLNEIQNSLTEINPSLSWKSLNPPRPPERSYLIQPDDPEPPVILRNIESI